MIYLFFISFFSLTYIYFLYPLLLKLFFFKAKKINLDLKNYQPKISLIISAFNEEKYIKNTLINKLELKYPKEKLQIIVVSDGSIDQTNKILFNLKKENFSRIDLIINTKKQGKAMAINKALKIVKNELIVISDANTFFAKNALLELVKPFKDQNVGYVTGKLENYKTEQNKIQKQTSLFLIYENYLRELESKKLSIIGVNGGIDAIRTKLIKPLKNHELSDFVYPLLVMQHGFRVVLAKRALAYEEISENSKDNFSMRYRVSLRAFVSLFEYKFLFNFFKYKTISWQLFSHKLLRYNTFLFFIGLFVSNLFLTQIDNFKVILAMQVLFYLTIFCDLFFSFVLKKKTPFSFLSDFFLAIFSAFFASIMFLFGKKISTWKPRAN